MGRAPLNRDKMILLDLSESVQVRPATSRPFGFRATMRCGRRMPTQERGCNVLNGEPRRLWSTRNGQAIGRLGQGTWQMGLDAGLREQEVAILQLGVDRNLRHIDTAEAYGGGEAERIVGDAIRGRRGDVFVTTKVRPQNASREGVVQSLENSLARLGTDAVDLYLLHWPSQNHPLEQSLAGLQDCVARGLTRYIGVSNFTTGLLEDAMRLTDGQIATNQVAYSLMAREPEVTLLPYMESHGVFLTAYSPLRPLMGENLSEAAHQALRDVASRHGVTEATVAMAWVLGPDSRLVTAIPKTLHRDHLEQNIQALALVLTSDDLHMLDEAFPPPTADLQLRKL